MYVFWIQFLYIIGILTKEGYALSCLHCEQAYFNGEAANDICYKVNDPNIANCTDTSVNVYCFTKVEVTDGMISYIKRGCTNPLTDQVDSTTDIPDTVKCRTTFSFDSTNIQQTECHFPCIGSNCNDVTLANNLKSCPNVCPQNAVCNYLTGKCQCSEDRSGDECNSSVPVVKNGRSCVQCNSRIDENCDNETRGSKCPGGESHCSTTQTWIVKQDGTLASNSLITRACISRYKSPDRCYLTKTSHILEAKYIEYTCVSTCSSDNCNVGNANGVVDGKEFIPIECVVCEGDVSNCGPDNDKKTGCPINSTHCKATVSYWESAIDDTHTLERDRPQPTTRIRSIKRECAFEPVDTKCTSNHVASLHLKEVTCQESCIGDGCNTGWPARPKCVQCTKASFSSTGDECLFFPPTATYCPQPNHAYCFFELNNRTKYHNDRIFKNHKYGAKRGCSAYQLSTNKCRNGTNTNRSSGVICTKSCSTDGCNFEENDLLFLPGTNGAVTISALYTLQLIIALLNYYIPTQI